MLSVVLRSMREEKALSQVSLANALGVKQSTVAMWESGKNNPEYATLLKIAAYFDVNVDYLTGTETQENRGVKIPVLGMVQAGLPIEAIENIIDYEEISKEMARQGEYFGLLIKGDSMLPRICEGDIVIVNKQSTVNSGDIAIVLVNGNEATIKKVILHDAGITLSPFNPDYEPVFYGKQEIEELPVTILGKVVELRRKLD